MSRAIGIPQWTDTASTDNAEIVVESAYLRVEIVKLGPGETIPWQRCPMADRVFTVTEGSGYCYRSHGRDDMRDEISAGDVVYLKRMLWHQLVASSGEKLTGVLVTTSPPSAELRR